MTAIWMTPTDEPEVTEYTRFWLVAQLDTFERIYDHVGRFVETRRFGRPFVLRVEVDEQTYRRTYARETGHADDVTMPLDDYWWNDRQVWSTLSQTFSMRRYFGGQIDW